jgi:cytosine/adenosine deaminase-related metal-dependent hydrolase
VCGSIKCSFWTTIGIIDLSLTSRRSLMKPGGGSPPELRAGFSYLTAWAAGIKDRGCLREGLAADIIVYDLENLKILPSEVVHDLPAGEWRRVQKAEGYRWVLVNGQVTFADGKCTNATSGRLLRNGQAAKRKKASTSVFSFSLSPFTHFSIAPLLFKVHLW